MRALTRPLAVAALAAAAFAQPAAAAPHCAGEQSVFYVCVATPTAGLGSVPLCVYAGGSSCEPVDVPAPVVQGCPNVWWGGTITVNDPPFVITCGSER